MSTITLPSRGITLAEGWWALILWAGKDVENRGRGTAARLAGYRGSLLLTASKGTTGRDAFATVLSVRADLGRERWTWAGPNPIGEAFFEARRGCIVGVVDLVDAGGPATKADSYWAIPDSDHLVLANPRPLAPVPCLGARGVWYPRRCVDCGTLQGSENIGDLCRKCRRPTSWQFGEELAQ